MITRWFIFSLENQRFFCLKRSVFVDRHLYKVYGDMGKIHKISAEMVRGSHSLCEIAKKIDLPDSGSSLKRIKAHIKNSGFDCSHFNKNHNHYQKYPEINKKCPACGSTFKTRKGHPKEKTTCSRSCSNTYFRSGDKNPNWNKNAYRSTCFNYHEKKCVICDERHIVEVHHLDGNKQNNDPNNLIPLCPTHHQYWHSNHRHRIEQQVLNYVEEWKKTGRGDRIWTCNPLHPKQVRYQIALRLAFYSLA